MVWSPSKSIITSTVTHNTHLPHSDTVKPGLKTLQAQAWIYLASRRFTEIGQIFRDTVKPQYNEGSRVDWQYVLAISRFCCIEVLFHIF